MEQTYYVTQWQNSDGTWSESIGTDVSGGNQQAHYAEQAGIADPLSEEAAREFARVLEAASYAGRVRTLRRTDVLV